MFALRQQNWTPGCWENRTETQTRLSLCFGLSGLSFGSNIQQCNSAGYGLKTSIIPVAVNPICMERGHGLLLLFQANLTLCSKVVQWHLHKASLKMPNTPTAKNHRVNPQAKTSTWNWSFCRSISSWRIPQSILGSQLDHWGPLDQSHAGHLLLAHQGVRRPIVILWGVRGGSFGKKKLLLACIDGGTLPFSRGRSSTADVDLYTNGGPCAVTYRSVLQSY